MIARTSWDQLPDDIREAISNRTGTVLAARDASAGKNSALAIILHTNRGTVFVKGLRKDHPGVVAQAREALINPYIQSIGPKLLWQADVDAWDLLGFAHLDGRHADYRAGSSDIDKIIRMMRRLATLTCPDLPQFKRAERRWASYVDNLTDLRLLAGNTLLHTDYSPDNILIKAGTARLVDWAWPTLGASFIDPACFVVRLVAAGHEPAGAQAHVSTLPAWRSAEQRTIDIFAAALDRMWADIAAAEPEAAWKNEMASAARAWARHRT